MIFVPSLRLASFLFFPFLLLTSASLWLGDWLRGDVLVYVSHGGEFHLSLLDFTTGVRLRISPSGYHPTWLPDGDRLIYTRGDGAYIYDLETGEEEFFATSAQNPSWSINGQVIFAAANELVIRDLATGSERRLIIISLASPQRPAFSPDGTHITFDVEQGSEIYLYDLATGVATNLTQVDGMDFAASWSPDGTQLTFTSRRAGAADIYVMDLATREVTNLTNTPDIEDYDSHWSPDGTRIVFSSDREGNTELIVIDLRTNIQTNITRNPNTRDFTADWMP
jgi:Tol biopolymer transport system component